MQLITKHSRNHYNLITIVMPAKETKNRDIDISRFYGRSTFYPFLR